MSTVETTLSGPLYQQPAEWELNAMHPWSRLASGELDAALPFAQLASNAHLPALIPESPKAVVKPPPPDVPVIVKAAHSWMGEPKSVFKPPPPGVLRFPKQPPSGNQASPPSNTEKLKAPPPYNVTADPAYSQGVYRSPLTAKPILGSKALQPTITRPDIPKPVTGILPHTVPKAPPPVVPIGPPLPEGQAPPYAVQVQKQKKAFCASQVGTR